MDIRTTITKRGISKSVKRGGSFIQGVENGQRGKQGGEIA
jgi:hypothetical protein